MLGYPEYGHCGTKLFQNTASTCLHNLVRTWRG